VVVEVCGRSEVEIEASVIAAENSVRDGAIIVVIFVGVAAIAVVTCVSEVDDNNKLVLTAVAVARELEADIVTGMTVFAESPRANLGSAALAIPSSPGRTTSSVIVARNKSEFNFRELCDATNEPSNITVTPSCRPDTAGIFLLCSNSRVAEYAASGCCLGVGFRDGLDVVSCTTGAAEM
jgi:hypothetical protein